MAAPGRDDDLYQLTFNEDADAYHALELNVYFSRILGYSYRIPKIHVIK